MDHFMKGNSFFQKQVDGADWFKDVEAKVGTHA